MSPARKKSSQTVSPDRRSRAARSTAPPAGVDPVDARQVAAATDAGGGTGSAAERSLRLLGLLAREGRAMSLADLSAGLSLPKATTHRLCTALQDSGHLLRGIEERSYELGPALQALALDTLNHGTVRGLRHEVLAELVTQVGETGNFTTLDGASVVYLDRVEAPWPWRMTLDVGTHVPLHCTARGKLFLAHMAAERCDTLISKLSLLRLTVNTLTSMRSLRAECEEIARRGHAFDREEFITGLIALAVPVRDASGEVRAAIAVHAPSARMSLKDAGTRLPALLAAAARMGELL
jgi:IclR family transcriptional regulator, acetate operon repressor